NNNEAEDARRLLPKPAAEKRSCRAALGPERGSQSSSSPIHSSERAGFSSKLSWPVKRKAALRSSARPNLLASRACEVEAIMLLQHHRFCQRSQGGAWTKQICGLQSADF